MIDRRSSLTVWQRTILGHGCCLFTTIGIWFGSTAFGLTPDQPPDSKSAKATEPKRPLPASEAPAVEQFQFGTTFQAQGGGVKDVTGTVTVPADWPDQQRVRIVKEKLPPVAKVTYKQIQDVGRHMTVHVPFVRVGKEARAVVTFEVERLASAVHASRHGTFHSAQAAAVDHAPTCCRALASRAMPRKCIRRPKRRSPTARTPGTKSRPSTSGFTRTSSLPASWRIVRPA